MKPPDFFRQGKTQQRQEFRLGVPAFAAFIHAPLSKVK
ncbi:hypothetical protein M072_2364 [Bacteroides fragilis str. DS-208]|nr:hypothetical protein M072_2364 [Bacteroides fragilis str. DS-208]